MLLTGATVTPLVVVHHVSPMPIVSRTAPDMTTQLVVTVSVKFVVMLPSASVEVSELVTVV